MICRMRLEKRVSRSKCKSVKHTALVWGGGGLASSGHAVPDGQAGLSGVRAFCVAVGQG